MGDREKCSPPSPQSRTSAEKAPGPAEERPIARPLPPAIAVTDSEEGLASLGSGPRIRGEAQIARPAPPNRTIAAMETNYPGRESDNRRAARARSESVALPGTARAIGSKRAMAEKCAHFSPAIGKKRPDILRLSNDAPGGLRWGNSGQSRQPREVRAPDFDRVSSAQRIITDWTAETNPQLAGASRRARTRQSGPRVVSVEEKKAHGRDGRAKRGRKSARMGTDEKGNKRTEENGSTNGK